MTPPVAISLVICDQVIIEQVSLKVSLIGIFDRLRVDQFPSEPQRLSVFATFNDYVGECTMDLDVARMDTGDSIHHQSHRTYFTDKVQPVHVHLSLKRFVFPVAGAYQFSLSWRGAPLIHKRIQV